MRLTICVVAILLVLISSSIAIDLSRGIIYDIPQNELVKQYGKIPPSLLTVEDSMSIMSFQFDADTAKVLAIMVDWIDRPGYYSRETFDSLLFSRDIWPDGSMADYYHEVSYGKIVISGTVIDWQRQGLYSSNFSFQSVLSQVDPFVDFSQFDGNNDGDVDAVIFLRSGTGQEDTHNSVDIWSHAYTYPPLGGPGPFDGVYVSRWNTSPELYPMRNPSLPFEFSGVDTLNDIRVFTHELGHNLGLPDLYDYDEKLNTTTYETPNDDNDHPLYDWCVMGYGGYGIFSLATYPSHFSGWSKKELGWVEPTALVGTHTDLVINNVETTDIGSYFMVPINPADGEYFMIEYRNSQSSAKFDRFGSDFSCFFWPDLTYGSEPLSRGLLITHVHDSITSFGIYSNNGTPSFPHYGVIVEDAGYNPSMDYTMNPEGDLTDSAAWWYPYETRLAATWTNEVVGKEEFSPTSSPSSDSYLGASGIVIRVDSMVDDKLYAYVHNPNFDQDGDGWSDLFDNCVDVFNPDQADSTGNGTGDVCGGCCIGKRGNVNSDIDDAINISDVTYLVAYLFGIPTGPEPVCVDEANANGDIEEAINIADVSYLVAYLFGIPSGPEPPACP